MYKGKTAIYQGDNWHDNPELYQTEYAERTLMIQIDNLKKQLENVELIENELDEDSVDLDDCVIVDVEY